MSSDLIGSTMIMNSIPTPTEDDRALAKAYLVRNGHLDIIAMLDL